MHSQAAMGFLYNCKVNRNYQFCLVMENTKVDAYISEKIMLAFLGGCIPIYWGTLDVYEIFNANAFIYYDIDQPETAFWKATRLPMTWSWQHLF